MTKLIDCFTFYNEVELLRFRLKYLSKVVDKFIISEATKTHSGKDRELIFPTIKDSLTKSIQEKIVYVVVDDMSSEIGNNANWAREKHQRNCIQRGLDEIQIQDHDLFMLSDIDELPRRDSLIKIKEENILSCGCFNGYNFWVSVNHQVFHRQDDEINTLIPGMWFAGRIIRYQFYKETNIPVIDALRNTSQYGQTQNLFMELIENGGWHFSFFGGKERIKTKVESYAHQEFNNDDVKHPLITNIQKGSNIFGWGSWVHKPCDPSILDPEMLEDIDFKKFLYGNEDLE